MKQNKILNKVYNKKMDVQLAYDKLFTKSEVVLPKSRFIKVHIHIKDHPILSGFLKIFTLLPIPSGIVRYIINKQHIGDDQILTKAEILKLTSTKGVFVEVVSDEAYLRIKTL